MSVESDHRRVLSPAEGVYREVIHQRIALHGDLTHEQRERIRYIAGRCPMHRTLQSSPDIVEEVQMVEETA